MELDELDKLLIREYNEASHKMVKSHHAISKDIMLVSASLFGILVSLTDSSMDSYWARLFFVLSLFLISLGILLIGASMLGELSTDRHRLSKSMWLLKCKSDGKKYEKPFSENGGLSFYICLKIGIICLLVSMITLIIFIAIRNNIFTFPN